MYILEMEIVTFLKRKAVIDKHILPKKSGYILSRGRQISIDNFYDLAKVRKFLK